MDVPENRKWMYNRTGPHRGGITDEFVRGVDEFISHACQLPSFSVGGKMRCPCAKCKCRRYLDPELAKYHLYKNGFKENYGYWTSHGEVLPEFQPVEPEQSQDQNTFHGDYEAMVIDAAGPSFRENLEDTVNEAPNVDTKAFFDMLFAAQARFWEGCSHSELSVIVRLLSIKADYNLTVQCYNEILQLIREILPPNNQMPSDFYRTKKKVAKLGLGYVKIDCCVNGCMLYYKDDEKLSECKFCGHPRYKSSTDPGKQKQVPNKQMWHLPLIPRLQRLFASPVTAKEMRWHHDYRREPGVLSHPSDGEAWKLFNQTHPNFAFDPRNVRLGLCSDGFTPFGQYGRKYSCWPVMVTPYNLPPSMCMKQEYMFLTLIIPGPNNPKNKIDVYLQPLIDELKLLWDVGVPTYDVSKKQNFEMRAALMWCINDFPAYGMLSGWTTAGRLACPICMEHSKAFYLRHGQKISWFDCHRQFLPSSHQYRKNKQSFLKNKIEQSPPPVQLNGDQIWERVCNLPKIAECGQPENIQGYCATHNWTKQSIFWELPYWKTNLIRHNLDVMHIEKNVFDNVFHTVMDTKGKTKDNPKARMDIKMYCRRRELELKEEGGKILKPKAQYTLNIEQKRLICEWVENLRLPDGYASNLARCVDMKEAKLSAMKSHDCHVFMERLLPVAFNALPQVVQNPIIEISQFFKEICSTTLRVDQLEVMEQNIAVTLCKLERIFPPGLFNSMEHLPIHLPYEARVGGPVHYRWMYPFERFLHNLKKKVKNKARVEASICEAYIIEETATFCSHYFESHVRSRITRIPRNDDGGESGQEISLFNYPGRPSGECKTRFLNDREMEAATRYVLMNCDEVQPYLNLYVEALRVDSPQMTDTDVDRKIESGFSTWFKEYVQNPNNKVTDPFIRSMAWGPKRKVKTWPIYFINGYKFHIDSYSRHKSTSNSGVCIKGADYGQSENDYYGVLQEIVEVEYVGEPLKRLVLFNCEWFAQSPQGTRIHKQYGLVEVQGSLRYHKYDPFVFSQQATQVYYARYPSRSDNDEWLAVIRTKARSIVEAHSVAVNNSAYQEDEAGEIHPVIEENDDLQLRDSDGDSEEVDVNEDFREEDEDESEEDFDSEEDDDNLMEDDDNSSDDGDTLLEVFFGDNQE